MRVSKKELLVAQGQQPGMLAMLPSYHPSQDYARAARVT